LLGAEYRNIAIHICEEDYSLALLKRRGDVGEEKNVVDGRVISVKIAI